MKDLDSEKLYICNNQPIHNGPHIKSIHIMHVIVGAPKLLLKRYCDFQEQQSRHKHEN